MQTVVTERGQISIPASIREKFNLLPGTSIEWLEREGMLILFPVSKDPIKDFRDKHSKVSVDDLLKARALDRVGSQNLSPPLYS